MNERMFTIGPIMKAARKFKKFNQADVAQAIGCSQSALSKMEHNLLIPSAPQWFLFSRFTSIPPESLETGIIDRNAPVKFNSAEVSLGFKIPKRYRLHRAQKVREVYPFMQVLEKESPGSVTDFIQSTGIEPEFFLDFDNLINFHLMIDVINFFIKHGKSSPEDIKKIVEVGQNEIYWDHYQKEWKKLNDVNSLLNQFVSSQLFFQTDFQLKLDSASDRVMISYMPEYHIKQNIVNLPDEIVNFLNQYRKLSIQNMIKRMMNRDVTVELSMERMGSPLAARFDIRTAA